MGAAVGLSQHEAAHLSRLVSPKHTGLSESKQASGPARGACSTRCRRAPGHPRQVQSPRPVRLSWAARAHGGRTRTNDEPGSRRCTCPEQRAPVAPPLRDALASPRPPGPPWHRPRRSSPSSPLGCPGRCLIRARTDGPGPRGSRRPIAAAHRGWQGDLRLQRPLRSSRSGRSVALRTQARRTAAGAAAGSWLREDEVAAGGTVSPSLRPPAAELLPYPRANRAASAASPAAAAAPSPVRRPPGTGPVLAARRPGAEAAAAKPGKA